MNKDNYRAHARDHAFFSKSGTTIATWGPGFVLIMAPMGPSVLFVAWLSQPTSKGMPVIAVCLAMLSFTTLMARRERRRSRSPILRDSGKMFMAYAAFEVFVNLSQWNLRRASLGAFLTIWTLQYISIAVAVVSAGNDLEVKGEGAWQGVFSGRALATIRRTRVRVFEVITKAPVIGWLFHLGEKAASNLHGTFGRSKTWTISHYCICFVIAIGAFSTDRLLQEFFINREPLIGAGVFVDPDPERVLNFRILLTHLASTLIYIGIIFFAGSIFHLRYLRALAFVLASFLLAIQAFHSLSQKAAISIFFHPLAFCCVMGLFRILHDRYDEASSGGERPGRVG